MRTAGLRMLLIASVLLQGCTSWRTVPSSTGVAPVLSTERPVRVSLSDGTVIVLESPRIAGDSLIGNLGNPPERLAVAMADVTALDERKVSVGRSAAAVGVGVGALTVLFGILILAVLRAFSPCSMAAEVAKRSSMPEEGLEPPTRGL